MRHVVLLLLRSNDWHGEALIDKLMHEKRQAYLYEPGVSWTYVTRMAERERYIF